MILILHLIRARGLTSFLLVAGASRIWGSLLFHFWNASPSDTLTCCDLAPFICVIRASWFCRCIASFNAPLPLSSAALRFDQICRAWTSISTPCSRRAGITEEFRKRQDIFPVTFIASIVAHLHSALAVIQLPHCMCKRDALLRTRVDVTSIYVECQNDFH